MFLTRCFRLQRFFPAYSVVAVTCVTAVSALADYPLVSHRYAADPTGLEYNGRLYLYCSNDDENGTNSYIMTSITCFSTDDLKNWTDHGVVFKVPQNASWASLAWAPSAISNYNKLYLYFANGAGSIGVATSSVPTGPFTDARGSALITGSTPGASTSTQWLFDPCAFIDNDGQPYLYFGGQYPTNARVILLNTNMVSVSGSATPVFATNFFEASYLHKRGGTYYFTYCTRFEVGAVIACETNSNPTTGFVPQGTVLANPPQNVNNNNHHSIINYQGNWYIAYHNRAAALQNGLSAADAVYKRSVCLDQVNYNADGSIQQVSVTTNGLPQLKSLNPFNRVEAETIAQQSGIKTEVCSEGGLDVTSVTNGSWIRVRGVNFGAGTSTFFARAASAGNGGNIELRLDSLAGTLVGTCAVSPTGGWQTWTTASCSISGASGVHDLYLKFVGRAGNLFNVNWWQFQSGTSASVLSHRYGFSETSGTTVADSVGGPAWNGTLPNGGTFSGGQLILSSNSQQYVNLPAGILSNLTAVTIEAWATFPLNLPWPSWFFGFGDINGTVGRYYLFCSPGGDRFAITGRDPGYLGETNAYAGMNWSGKTLHIACVVNPPAGYIAIYTNGVLAGTNRLGTYSMNSIINKYSFINRSLYSADPYVNLTLNEFRIYNAALSSADVAATEALGPNQLLSTDSPPISLTATPTDLTLIWPLASAGFTLQSRTNLVLGDWVNVTSPTPQIVGSEWRVTLPLSGNAASTFYRLVR